ncbi:hypothetical protein [Paraburkholderia sp. 32]|uniref:hypothetical protein n=1 Tax=Paraburkholderia sp. 32 TaxID=2991057 RepID=UPI003D1E9468
MGAEDVWSDWSVEQKAALVQILGLGQADTEAGRFRDAEEFLTELEQERPDN